MKFGKLTLTSEFELGFPNLNIQILQPNTEEKLELITAGTVWNVPQWKGKHIPKATLNTQLLSAYSKVFTAIEFNGSFYRIPQTEQIEKWRCQVEDDFLFCPKWPQSISHWRQFENCEREIDLFFVALDAFGKNLGPSFIQLPHHFGVQKIERFMRFLENLPHDLKLGVEFRHSSWFENNNIEEIAAFFSHRNWSIITSDTLGRRDAMHGIITSSDLIIRFGGAQCSWADTDRIGWWVSQFPEMKSKGVKRVWIWIHQEDSVLTPESAQQWLAESMKLQFVQGR
jgi:uncharacterized protein YecE (DUF72 family)